MSADPRCMKANPNGAERKQIDGDERRPRRRDRLDQEPGQGHLPREHHAGSPRSAGLHVHAHRRSASGRPAPAHAQQRRDPPQHPPPARGERRLQRRPAAQGHGDGRRPSTSPRPSSRWAATCIPGCAPTSRCSSIPSSPVTKEDGTFEIPNVPPGEYEIEAQHPTLKIMTGKVVVKAGAAGYGRPDVHPQVGALHEPPGPRPARRLGHVEYRPARQGQGSL